MTKEKTTSYRLGQMTLNQIDSLAESTGMSKANVVQTAIDRMYQQETQTMTEQAQQLTITSIDTKPEYDPYTNISGIVSRTYLKLDPRDNTIWVSQEYNDNSTPSDEWHNLVLTWRVPGNPTEEAMRQWIDENMSSFTAICNGYESRWDGSNHVGSLNEQARASYDAIEFMLDNDAGPYEQYEYWSLEAWTDPMLSDITAATTDEELRGMANDAITALGTNQVLDTDEDGVYRYFSDRRDELKAEADDE